jgi:hypothetical protein
MRAAGGRLVSRQRALEGRALVQVTQPQVTQIRTVTWRPARVAALAVIRLRGGRAALNC